ncbi:hypothetical protein GCM10009749_04640 [Agromyces neolithicus]|uniref:Uncharacterized protein n=1 Tax=Agromyces neolithicus TaxID=269420 RepID=A0ABP4Y2V0_9MICO
MRKGLGGCGRDWAGLEARGWGARVRGARVRGARVRGCAWARVRGERMGAGARGARGRGAPRMAPGRGIRYAVKVARVPRLCGLHDVTYAQPSCCRDPVAV